MKKVHKIIFRSILGTIIGTIIVTAILFGSILRSAFSVEKLDEGLYYMEYHGDDGFGKLMERGGGKTAGELVSYIISFLSKGFYKANVRYSYESDYGCTTLTARSDDGRVLMGRNFDFPYGNGIIFHSYPRNGYESITTFNSDFYGFGENWVPEGFVNQYLAVTGLFFALDGINEKGLVIADLMAGDNVETHQNTGKPALTTTAAIKYILNKAATVDEAVKLLRQIDMHSDIGSAHHYAMSDASGKSIVVEYVDNQIVIVDSPALANHYLCEQKFNVGLAEDDHRYESLCKMYEDANGIMSIEEITDAIESVSHPQEDDFLGTAWTMVMDLTNPSVTYYSRRHFENPSYIKLDCRK